MVNVLSYFTKEKGWYWLKEEHYDLLNDTRNVVIVTEDGIIDEEFETDPETNEFFFRPLKISDIMSKTGEGYIISIIDNGDIIKKINLKNKK